MRTANILFLLLLLALLVSSTVLYCYETHVIDILCEKFPVIEPYLQRGLDYSYQYKIDVRWGIGIVLAIVASYYTYAFWKKPIAARQADTAVYFFGALILMILGSGLYTVCTWENDTLRFGTFYTFNRGPKQQFVAKIWHYTTLIVSAYLLWAILANLWRYISLRSVKYTGDAVILSKRYHESPNKT